MPIARSLATRSFGAGAPAPALSGLLFPSNISGSDTSAPYAVIQFLNPQSDGLPIWGPSGAGVTVIREYKPVQQTGYYAAFWWSNDGFLWDAGGPNTYWGMHPYPDSGTNSGTTHSWEIATDYGGDYAVTRGGSAKAVVQNSTYLQGIRVTKNGDSTKTLVFYTSLPSVANADVIEHTCVAAYGETTPPNPRITIGDSPWYAGFQHERLSGTLGRIKIFAAVLSEADMLSEAGNMNSIVTSAGAASIWWGKRGFVSVDDLTCDYGTGRSFSRNDSSNLITLAPLP